MSEGALVVAAAKARISGLKPFAQYERIPKCELPFSSDRKMMVTVHKLPTNARFEAIQFDLACKYVAIIKGAPDVVEPHVSHVLTAKADGTFRIDNRELDSSDKTWFKDQNDKMSGDAQTVAPQNNDVLHMFWLFDIFLLCLIVF